MLRLRGDLHTHSSVSDGRESPEEIVLTAIDKELGVIAITDHDSFLGSLKARKVVRELGVELVVVIGAEIRTEAGDILVYCSENPLERIPRNPFELVDVAREEGCLVVPAHPFDIRRKGISELVYRGRWDAIEVFNAYSDPLSNRRAVEAARVLKLPGLANSDAHVAAAIGSAYNIIEVREPSAEEVLEAIRVGRVTPVAGRPSISAVFSQAAWSIKRRIMRRNRGPSRLNYLEEGGIRYEES
ncbi:PHP-associated domain-containing protein [Hyperthermus butylicus]|uniref:Universally conserved protein n=1 Tax=Hyperthermus butylicus (strain DSM 5456 / JCM 9403 / PLM1-5) TaxID=415426 RepID=A2BLD2_HYPBU|nr:PHP domain-containing protein [Hyperthermus butylicus]ABM80793.1 universally conserved protein [Hyperthermus butylicus DSM 5456]